MTPPLLTFDTFADKIGHSFALDGPEAPPIALTLTEAAALPNHNLAGRAREPFSLFFTTTGNFILPQQMYGLRHETLGSLAIFLVPVGREGDTVTYQAIFN